MKVLVSGGSKNGKSSYAEDLAVSLSIKDETALYYVATMIPTDDEDCERIIRHRISRKDKGFTTIECGRDIFNAVIDPDGTYLIDSATAVLANEMFLPDGTVNDKAYTKTAEDIINFMEKARNTVVVSDYIYSDARLLDDFTEDYRRGLAYIDRKVAESSNRVCEVTFGQVIDYKEYR